MATIEYIIDSFETEVLLENFGCDRKSRPSVRLGHPSRFKLDDAVSAALTRVSLVDAGSTDVPAALLTFHPPPTSPNLPNGRTLSYHYMGHTNLIKSTHLNNRNGVPYLWVVNCKLVVAPDFPSRTSICMTLESMKLEETKHLGISSDEFEGGRHILK